MLSVCFCHCCCCCFDVHLVVSKGAHLLLLLLHSVVVVIAAVAALTDLVADHDVGLCVVGVDVVVVAALDKKFVILTVAFNLINVLRS